MQRAKPLTKPTKQRKMLYQAPAHVRHRLLAAHLSPGLRATHIAKSFPVRNGDTIRVMRGDHKGFEGKISRIDLKKYRIYVEGLTREKVDGTTVFVPVHPSKLMITKLNLDDKWRKRILERKLKPQKKPEKALKKPKAEPVEKPPETVELKQPAVEEKGVEEKGVEEKGVEEKAAAATGRRPKKKVSQPRKKTKAAAEETGAQGAEIKLEKEPKVQKKRTKRKSAKKTEEGEG
ncbi:MAG: 50S ribosomal protein L24 [Candidatus Bathyarchaeia archaeon]|jgi:large subunit ribosomal protein L24